MNRLFAQIFAACIGAIHVVVLLGLALALVGAVLDWPPAMSGFAAGIGGALPVPIKLGIAFVAYVLVMGLISTVVAINQNLERLARNAERRHGYDEAAERDGIEAEP